MDYLPAFVVILSENGIAQSASKYNYHLKNQ